MQHLQPALSCALTTPDHGRLSGRARDLLVRLLVTAPARLIAKRAMRKAALHLVGLDDRVLRDIGLDRRDLEVCLGDYAAELRRGEALLGPVYGSFNPFR